MEKDQVPVEASKPEIAQREVQTSRGEVFQESMEIEISPQKEGCHLDIDMEAPITVDQIKQSDGLGAMDDITGFLPAAIDSSDYESVLRNAREFEGLPTEISRAGLGWEEPK
ncbi:unnamed protein product [Spirodela intermedia]|uniref:Uncharacterized protein n=1 Tax=Spirodela intermedia TaxID=51605 RepID=A0A7I8KRX6_SPIIN|nr:unnamed protein product [Spirodela intermedia]